jgi:hypothetical protein
MLYMTGALMQLVSYGAQNIYLTGNPMITFFKTVYRRHTNFAMETIKQVFNGTPDFDRSLSTLISRNGDLISQIYLQATLPAIIGVDISVERWTDNVGHHLLSKMELEIGGQLIDRQYGDWLDIWAQLTVPAGQKIGYYEMIGQDTSNGLGGQGRLQHDTHTSSSLINTGLREIYIPLQFWFCRNIGLALPLIALQYHEVKVNITFAKMSALVRFTDGQPTGELTNVNLWVDYIYLDSDERRRFGHIAHEYLIEQIQTTGDISVLAGTTRTSPTTVEINLADFNHPVKELIWVVQNAETRVGLDRQNSNYTSVKANVPQRVTSGNALPGLQTSTTSTPLLTLATITNSDELLIFSEQSCVIPSGALNPVVAAQLQLNGHDRFEQRPGTYFNWVQCREHHTNIPDSPGINVYSFAIKPEQHQPSGTCNFSRIDHAKLILQIAMLTKEADREINYPGTITTGTDQFFTKGICNVRVYAVNYNVLRIMSGMGGLAYTN